MLSHRQFHLFTVLLVIPLLLTHSSAARAEEKTEHPLDPLTETEINTATKLIREKHGNGERLLFPMLALQEPTKDELANHRQGKPCPRRALAVVLDKRNGKISEALVNLTMKQVTLTPRPRLNSMVTVTQMEAMMKKVQANKEWQAAIRKRGIKNLDNVYLSVWAPGQAFASKPDNPKYRVIAYYFDKGQNETSTYGQPIEGVVGLVDELTGKVVIEDAGNVGYPPESADFFQKKIRGQDRKAPSKLEIRHPKGKPGFVIRGHEVQWQNWSFRYAMHPREGLVLYQVSYKDQGQVRRILDRASLSEMVVPYGDPGGAWNWRSAFDQGEYGIGWYANPLELGLDVPENARLFDAVFPDDLGKSRKRQNVIGIYERDGGLLWKHHDERTFDLNKRKVEARRARDLVITSTHTVGNYDYAFYWIFRQDGSIQVRVGLTGILLAKGVSSKKCLICQQIDRLPQKIQHKTTIHPSGDQQYSQIVGRQVVAVNHQHIFNFRLDFAVDGSNNSFSEMNVRPYRGPGNPRANGFIQTETIFAREREVRRSISLEKSRTWKVFNPQRRNSLGHHRSYVLIPEQNGVPYLGQDTALRKRAAFMDHHVWVTRYRPGELHAAGDYPRQNPRGEGLPKWSGNESIVNKDLVLWYTLVTTHVPRPEEWPVMPTAEVGFRLVPWGFFSRNPALDVPKPQAVQK